MRQRLLGRPGRASRKDRGPGGRRRDPVRGRRSWSPSPPRAVQGLLCRLHAPGLRRSTPSRTRSSVRVTTASSPSRTVPSSRTRPRSRCPPRRSRLTATGRQLTSRRAGCSRWGGPPYSAGVADPSTYRPAPGSDPDRPGGLSLPRCRTAGSSMSARPSRCARACRPTSRTSAACTRARRRWCAPAPASSGPSWPTRSRRSNSNTRGSRSSTRASTSSTATTSPTPISP
jgi:hypothetical protein